MSSVERKISISLSITQIHAEKLVESMSLHGEVAVQLQLALPAGTVRREGDVVKVPFTFTAHTTPPLATISIRGVAELRCSGEEEVEKLVSELQQGKVPQPLFATVFQVCYFETLLLMRELGFPPPIPPPQLPEKTSEVSTSRTGMVM